MLFIKTFWLLKLEIFSTDGPNIINKTSQDAVNYFLQPILKLIAKPRLATFISGD